MEHVAAFTVDFHRYVSEKGELTTATAAAENSALVENLYRAMAEARLLDEKIISLQRTGQLGTYASILGQEAIGAAVGYALAADDIFVPYYRDIAAQLIRGVSHRELLLYWGGDERGNNFEHPIAAKDFPFCIPIATQVTHAAGVAAAMKIRGRADAVLVTCGDGATSRGEFLESVNLAGAWKLPLVIVINNNQWAISERLVLQTKAKTLAQKAIAAGIPGEQVDGNDAIAIYERVTRALQHARAGHGPTLIEAITYRLGDHTTADDATRYRPREEVDRAWEAEPLKRTRAFMESRGYWNAEKEAELIQSCKAKIEQGVQQYLAAEPQTPASMFDFLYENLPQAYHEQRSDLIRKTQRLEGGA
jgi:2-oxoisovalerate dehydrogenase E1 component alpha subunit